MTFSHQFVDTLPDVLGEGIVYISGRFATVAHNCFCGCGREVVTPLHPSKWQLGFDGKSISLRPSVGSWSLPCQSHYWLSAGRVDWAPRWSRKEIAAGRANDKALADAYYGKPEKPAPAVAPPAAGGLWGWLQRNLFG